MAAENVYYWTDHATSRFAKLNPDDDEVDALDACMIEVAAGKHDVSPIPFGKEFEGHFLFRCGRFAVIFWYASDIPEIIDVILWNEEWE